MRKKEKSNRPMKTVTTASEQNTKRLDHAPDPRGKNDQQIDTDLDNY